MFQSSGYLVIILVSLIALVDHFDRLSPAYRWRWWVLALLLAFFGLEVLCQHYWTGRLWVQRVVLAMQAAIIIALMLITPISGYFPILFFVLAVKAAMLFAEREWLLWLVAFFVLTTVTFGIEQNWQIGILNGLLYGGAYFFFGTFAKTTRDAEAARQETSRLLDELSEANAQLQDYAAQVQELTIVAERSRMAREMHDTVGHRLTVSAVQLEAAQRICTNDPERAKQMMATVREQVSEALTELRQTVAVLRAPVAEDLSLSQSLQQLATDFQNAIALDVQSILPDPMPDLPPAYRKAIYRAAQESLTNVQRHADARHVWLRLQTSADAITLTVADDGIGVPVEITSNGFGLRGLRERAAQLGGDYSMTTRPGGGAQSTFSLPWHNEAAHV